MNAQLRALLAAVGVAFVGGVSYTLWAPKEGVTLAQLQGAGIGSGTQREAQCTMWRKTAGGVEYASKQVPGMLFSADKGYVTSKKFVPAGWTPWRIGYVPDAGLPIYDCKPAPANVLGANEDSRDIPPECACAPALPDGGVAASTCEMKLTDGGWAPGAQRRHFPAGKWRNGCTPKPCIEMAGATSWPAACGPESVR